MVEKIMLSIYVVGINEVCDFSVPVNMAVKNAVQLMKKMIAEEYLDASAVNDNGKSLLIKADDGKLLSEFLNFSQLGLSNGERLILA